MSRSGARFITKSSNSKLSPVISRSRGEYQELTPQRPFVCSTYVSIQATCSSSCAFRYSGCYAIMGVTGKLVRTLDTEASGSLSHNVVKEEAALIDAAFRNGVPQDGGKHGNSGRDLRLHVSGETPSTAAAILLSRSAQEWERRGGGRVWTYTHSWDKVDAESWGPIQVLASCEHPRDVIRAQRRGYATALVVRRFEDRVAYEVEGMPGKLLPCPAETASTTCVQCRLCMNTAGLRQRGITIGFSVHGPGASRAKKKLPILNSLFGVID